MIYPDKIFYEYWKKDLYTLSGSESILRILDSGEKIIFQNKNEESNEKILENLKNNYKYTDPEIIEVYTNSNGESVYEIKLK